MLVTFMSKVHIPLVLPSGPANKNKCFEVFYSMISPNNVMIEPR